MLSDTESHSIALKVLPAPHFADGEKFAVQQGAGMAVAKTTDAEAEFMTDEYFEAWYQSLCDALRQYEG